MVKRLKLRTRLGFCTLMLGLSGAVNSACYIDTDHPDVVGETNALGVQEDSGQGNYDCSVLTTPDGAPMANLVGAVAVFETNAANPLTIDWRVDSVDTDGDDIPDSRNNVYLVSTFNKGQGKRCNYLYEAGVSEGAGLGAKNSGAVETVTVCGEPEPTVLPAETGIVTTLGEECNATYVYDGTSELGEQLAVSFGFTAGSVETVTACASYEYDPTETPPIIPQTECAPPPYPLRTPVPPDGGDCSTPNVVDGSYPLSCAPVEYDAGDLKYCWYYENRVCEADVTTGYCVGRDPYTYIPKTKKGSLNIAVDVMDGSTCYTYYLRGRAYHHCY